MPSGHIAGSFTGDRAVRGGNMGQGSAELIIPNGVTQAKLWLQGGLDSNNRVRTYRSSDGGVTFTIGATYNSDQNGTNIAVQAGQIWRLAIVELDTLKTISYKFSVES